MNTRAKELDRKFDVGEDITRYLDLSKPRRPGYEQRRVNVENLEAGSAPPFPSPVCAASCWLAVWVLSPAAPRLPDH
jgi:hypothetical protein